MPLRILVLCMHPLFMRLTPSPYLALWLNSDQELHQLRLKRRGLANKKRAGAKNPPTGPNDNDAATVDASKVRRPTGHTAQAEKGITILHP